MTVPVRRDLTDRILTISLARPEKLNALSLTLINALERALDVAADVRVVILRGDGRSFCAGADIEESLGAKTSGDATAFLETLARVLGRISSSPVPVVAAVQGNAVGGGAEMALEADVRVIADDAVISFPDVAIGSSPTSAYQLVRLLGTARANEILVLGETLDAQEMKRLGLAHRVVAPEQLDDAAIACALRLRDRAGPQSLRLAKRAVALAWESSRASDLNANVAAMLACYYSPEQQAAVAAFLERSRADAQE